ncbi:MAG TPA: tRNA preQ1(34) S-adenosylmethionine ribosyltransferase-isomerase QueA [Anaerolineae bacterium]|nr:tRNA preQ1(34) S-adenosylmethionine ribosyltransferase-isomerase QueA [Anaerolineae bacterium]
MKTIEFDYELPPELIAQTPAEPRDSSRLLVVHRESEQLEHRIFRDVVEYLRPGDLLVANDTRVIPARLFGRKRTGGKVEVFLLKRLGERRWECLVRGHRLRPGVEMEIAGQNGGRGETPAGEKIRARIVAETPSGGRIVEFDRPISPRLPILGHVPLPPYIHTPLRDPERYQTVYARTEGSVAAPTAGLHFTPELLLRLREMGVGLTYVTLHIGLDTFRPVQTENVEDHPMHTEWCELTPEAAQEINETRLAGGRIVAVGTTAVRVLETAAACCTPEGEVCGWQTVAAFHGLTDLFITPGYRFRAVDVLITNFHLPRSTLLMLVSAFAGRDLIFRAYQEAIRLKYRFYSFGDAMLVL